MAVTFISDTWLVQYPFVRHLGLRHIYAVCSVCCCEIVVKIAQCVAAKSVKKIAGCVAVKTGVNMLCDVTGGWSRSTCPHLRWISSCRSISSESCTACTTTC